MLSFHETLPSPPSFVPLLDVDCDEGKGREAGDEDGAKDEKLIGADEGTVAAIKYQ